MEKKWIKGLGALALLMWLGGTAVHAQVNNGWIQSDQYNMLFPLLNPDGCGGGGAAKMAGNWVAPHVLGAEDPVALEVWNDIDFGGAALAAGWGGGTIPGAADPIWITNASFEAAFVLPAGSMPVYEGVDFQALSVWINDTLNALDPPPDPPVALPNDNVLGIATTYVENTSGAPLVVDICSASDDSIQVWVNNVMTTNVSACRGWSGNCQERRAAVLPTGVSKITGLVWEGGGGWGLRIGLEVDGVKVDEVNDFGITFLGPGPGTTQEQYAAERTRGPEDPLECEGAEDAEVIITGNGVGDAADALTVVETVSFAPGADVTVDASANGGVVTDVTAPDDGILFETGAALEFFVLGPIANPGGAAPGVPAIQQSYLAGGDAIIDTLNEGDVVADIDAVDQTVRRIPINSGDALDFNQVGGGGDNIMHYAWTKVTLADERQVVVGGGSDDSVQLLVNGVEVALHNGGRGFGGFGEIQDFTVSCVLTLGAGTHTILAKVYEGGGGHGVRVVMLEMPAGGVGPGSVDCATATPIAPGEYGVGCTKGAATGIAACPDAQVSGAHYYVVTGTGGDITVETCGPQFLYDTHMVVFQDCVAITCVAQNDDTCGRQSQITFASTAGQDYIIQVHGWDNREGPYVLKVSDASNPPADVNPVPLTGSGVCADPDGVCDTEAETVVAKQITWDTTRGDVDAGLSYTVATTTAANVNLSGSVETAAGDPEAFVTGVGSLALVAGNSGPVGAFDDSRDIGNPPIAGSIAELGGGAYEITGSGNDIWDGGDDFFFAYQYVEGDFVATMRVLSRSTSPQRWGRHGLMARYDCTRGSKFSMCETQAPTGNGPEDWPRHHFRRDHRNNGNNRDYYQVNDGFFPTDGRLPTWMRLVRVGNALYSYMAEDANGDDQPDKWCIVGSDSHVGMPLELLVGVAIHGRQDQTTTITFDNFSIETMDTPEDARTCLATEQLQLLTYDTDDDLGTVVVRGGGFTPATVASRLRLTEEDIGSSAVAVWYGVPKEGDASAPLLDDGFIVEFDAFMTRAVADPPENSNPADGMSFAAVATGVSDGLASAVGPFPIGLDVASLAGDGGGAEGYEGGTMRERTECHPSFAVEMDNWVGGGEPGNEPGGAGSPDGDFNYHMGVNINASVSSIQTNVDFGVGTAAMPNIFDPDGIHVEVLYLPSGVIKAWVSGKDASGAAVPRTQILSTAIPPLPSGDVLLGFTGGTGGATCTQEIDNFKLSAICCEEIETVEITGPAEVNQGETHTYETVVTGAEGDVTYEWSVASGTATLSATNTASVDVTFDGPDPVVLAVTVDDGTCETGASAEYDVNVIPGTPFIRGDCNQDGEVCGSVSDIVRILEITFLGTQPVPDCPAACDANGDGEVFSDTADALYVANYCFLGTGPAPPAPYPDCDRDPGADCEGVTFCSQ